MPGVLRTEQDVGLLTNVRMALEIAVGLAHLTGRRLSMPFETPIGPSPVSSIPPPQKGRPSGILDLFELPVPIVHADEWATELEGRPADVHDWGTAAHGICSLDRSIVLDDRVLADFLNGRTKVWSVPHSEADVLQLEGRLLCWYSYFFHAHGAARRRLHATLRGVRPRRPYREIGASIAADLGRFNAVHIRRSDLTVGIPAYDQVTPETIADNLAALLPDDARLLVCSEMTSDDELFEPLGARFSDIAFANDLILGDNGRSFFDLPRHEDNALGLVTQEVAARAETFVGTMGSTFTGMIQRQRIIADPTARFLYTADFTPPGPTFVDGEFREIGDGCFTWNRIGLNMSPDVLAWFREWPEAA